MRTDPRSSPPRPEQLERLQAAAGQLPLGLLAVLLMPLVPVRAGVPGFGERADALQVLPFGLCAMTGEVMPHMLGVGQQLQVLNRVVGGVPVAMVDVIALRDLAVMHLPHEAMQPNAATGEVGSV